MGAKKGALWGYGASAGHFGEKFIQQKLLGTPNLVGIVTSLDTRSGRTWARCASGAMVPHFEGEFIK